MTHPTDSIRRCASFRRSRSVLFFFALLGGLLATGCRPRSAAFAGAQVSIEFAPAPPTTGVVAVKIALTDDAGRPIRLGRLDVEGNMNHAGMRPVFAHLDETSPGHYVGTIEFTMGGDWFLLLTGTRPDGGRFEKKVNVPGVKAQ